MSWATVIAVVGWIVGDTLVSIVTAPYLPRWEWWGILFGGGVLALLTLVGGILDRRAQEQQAQQIQRGQDILAGGNLQVLAQLQDMTNSSGQPIARTIQLATEKIEILEAQVTNLTSMFWRRLTPREMEILQGLLRNLSGHTIRISADAAIDCRELAADLARSFEKARWNIDHIGLNDIVDEVIVTKQGIHILGKFDEAQIGAKVMEILQSFVTGGIGYVAYLPASDPADALIYIGPKGGRRSLPT